MRRLAALLSLAAAGLLFAPAAHAAPALVPIGSGWSSPIYAAAPPRDPSRLFVVQRGGLVRVVVDGALQAAPFADLTGSVGTDGERGLLSIAFPPDYETSGLAYVYLAAPDGELQIRELRRSAADPNVSDGTSRIVWRQAHDQAANHNGGTLAFGPDGMLWFATGDGGGANDQFGHAQDLGSQLGKLLRIDPRAQDIVPPDNPFGTTVWAIGLRNPFRFSFDRGTGDLVIGDVGQAAREEVDWARAADQWDKGGNFGWSCREGFIEGPTMCPAGTSFIDPVFDYEQPSPKAITGGVVVRDPGLRTLLGRYLYSDSYAGDIRSLALGRPATDDRTAGLPARPNLVAFGEDACGHVYVVTLSPGAVERIEDGAPGACVPTPDPRPLPTGGGTTPPSGGVKAPPPAPDTVAPRLVVTVSGVRSLATRRRLRVAITSDEVATVRIAGRLRGLASFTSRGASVPAARRTVLNARITPRAARRLRRTLARKRVIAALTIAASDAAGNTRTVARRLTIPRR